MRVSNSLAGSCLRARFGFVAVAWLAACGQAAWAQQVAWRHDYAAALRESADTGRVLLVEFGTTACCWCVKLDRTTLRDPDIVELLNHRFVPLKVHAPENRPLTEALHVRSFPTVILAAPDGTILATIAGYKEPAAFHDYLQRALARVRDPEWMMRDYEAATKAIAESDFRRALALLRGITNDGGKWPIQVTARQLLNDLEQQAAGRLVRAK